MTNYDKNNEEYILGLIAKGRIKDPFDGL